MKNDIGDAAMFFLKRIHGIKSSFLTEFLLDV